MVHINPFCGVVDSKNGHILSFKQGLFFGFLYTPETISEVLFVLGG